MHHNIAAAMRCFLFTSFFQYFQAEMNEASDFHVHDNIVGIHLKNGATANFEEYHHQIRRQVAGKGHEVYLRDIKHAKFKEMPEGIQTKIETQDGKVYEKIIFFYN
ncbi:ComGF family competence protein [Virgibacillus halophilus]|uniref:ComGF family competence protein n=1 Tax=Tigheibacillus halophilus TaxID=361280 RepID=A0ABU5CBS3_9BACI|nr:ComGF family competence protein [Virgibacillus halophilus]